MTTQNLPKNDRRSDVEILLVICIMFIVINFRWIYLFRRGQLFDIDEAGYLGISLVYFHALVNNGITSWIETIESSSPHAPFTMVISSLYYLVLGSSPLVGFLVIIFSGIVTIVCTYYLGMLIGGRRLGLWSSILVATSPIILNYTRSYHLALPITAVTTLALLALARSEQFANIKWALVFGIAVGLMPLTRTMAIAFVPALVLTACILAVIKPENRERRLVILALSLGVAILTAATWLGPNALPVFSYLTEFGYGARSAYHGYGPSQQSWIGLGNIIIFLQTLAEYVYLPNFVLIIIGICLLAFKLVQKLVRDGLKPSLISVINSKLFPPTVLIIEGTIALGSSQNKGSAFIAPLIPAMLLVSTYGLLSISSSKTWNHVTAGLIILVATMSSLPLVDLRIPAARPWTINVPLLGEVFVTDGRGTIQRYEAFGGYSTSNPTVPISSSTGSEWAKAIAATVQRLEQVSTENIPIGLALRHLLYNINTVNLSRLLSGKNQLPLRGIETDVIGDSVADYMGWLKASTPCLLLTASAGVGEMLPAVNAEHMETAARDTGFSTIDQWPLPDGREAKLWKSSYPGCQQAKVQLGDRFGRVDRLSADELFVHPGQTTATSLEMPVDGSWRSLSLSIPKEVLQSCPDANGVHVLVESNAQRVWDGAVRPGSPETVSLPQDGDRALKLVVDSNGQPNCDHLHVKFVR